ncbi:MAG: hypothetical protein RL253_780 [Bacteroidota bacterium]|jgi:hypothetical protein
MNFAALEELISRRFNVEICIEKTSGRKRKKCTHWRTKIQCALAKSGILLKKGKRSPGEKYHRFVELPAQCILVCSTADGCEHIFLKDSRNINEDLMKKCTIRKYYYFEKQ